MTFAPAALALPSVDAPWWPAFYPFLLATGVCILTVPLTMALARRTGAVAHPDADRHIHDEPTPRLGGIALFAGFAVAMAVYGGSVASRWQIVAVCGAITVAMAVDDILDLRPRTKLALELAAGAAVAACGITIGFVAVPQFGIVDFGLAAAPLTVVYMTGMQITTNLLDGADGVAAGVVAIVAGVLLLAAINRLGPHDTVQSGVIVMSGALMGCCFGFLFWNVAPARTFMGDSGSHFLGVALGIMTILGVAKVAVALSLLVPLVTLGLPIGDTAAAIVRRRRAGVGIAQPDAGHLHHRLLALGLSMRETAMAFYLGTAILGCIGLAVFGHRRVLFAAMVLLAVSLGALLWRNHRRGLPEREVAGRAPRGQVAMPTRAGRSGEAD